MARNGKEGTIAKNLSTAFLANIVTLLGSMLLTLVLPKFIGVTEYSYYQLYVFYTSYAGFFALGWTDGLYLRHGGEYYQDVDKSSIHGQLRIFSLAELIISFGICMFALISSDANKTVVYALFGLCILVYLPRAFLHNLLQATNRVNQHATGLIIDKVVHVASTFVGILTKQNGSTWFIVSELIGRICGACYIFYVCRDVLRAKPCSLQKVNGEVAQNISCGFILMISNVASMLIIGVVRQGIEIFWDVETFGKLSLTLSISNMLMTFINSVAMVLFPLLRRSDESALAATYRKMRTVLILPMLGVLVFYYPVRTLLSAWLPHYAESLKYMAILFVMCIYESKMAMLINTYMKTLRKEKAMLRYNLITVIASVVLTGVTCLWMHNLDFAVVSIVILLAFRSTIAEIDLSRMLGIKHGKDIVIEHVMAAFFIVANWFIGGRAGMLIYAIIYSAFLVVNKKEIQTLLQHGRRVVARERANMKK